MLVTICSADLVIQKNHKFTHTDTIHDIFTPQR
jgi:hypothetical protein